MIVRKRYGESRAERREQQKAKQKQELLKYGKNLDCKETRFLRVHKAILC